MNTLKNVVLAIIAVSIFSCESQKTDREIEDEFVEKYAPADLETHGFTLAVDSKIPEVHQLFNDVSANFYFYGDKVEFEKKAARIKELDPNYPSGEMFPNIFNHHNRAN